MKKISISLEGTPNDYPLSLVPILIKHLGYETQWVNANHADLRILGPFQQSAKPLRLIPKTLRPLYLSAKNILIRNELKNPALTLFHTQENLRHNAVKADYSISYDLGVSGSNHFRFPYWMEMINWSHEGVTENINPRYGRLLSLGRLMQPLGSDFKSRQQKIAMITSHLNEPRRMLYDHLRSMIPIEGFGPYFDQSIRNHHQSSFIKYELLQEYAFNLCPENSLYPGYITEKIPEAFYAGCIPLTWVDTNVICDFNPKAMINLMPLVHEGFLGFTEFFHSNSLQENLATQSLIIKAPSLETFKAYLLEILRKATS